MFNMIFDASVKDPKTSLELTNYQSILIVIYLITSKYVKEISCHTICR